MRIPIPAQPERDRLGNEPPLPADAKWRKPRSWAEVVRPIDDRGKRLRHPYRIVVRGLLSWLEVDQVNPPAKSGDPYVAILGSKGSLAVENLKAFRVEEH